MDKAALVGFEIEKGQRILDALDRMEIPLEVAFWAVLPEYGDWRLVLSSSRISNYRELNAALDRASFPVHLRPVIHLLSIDDPLIQDMRNLYSHNEDNWGLDLGGHRFAGKYLEEGYAYRIR